MSLSKNVIESVKPKIADDIIKLQNQGAGIPEMQKAVKGYLDKPLRIEVAPKVVDGKVVRKGYTKTMSADQWGTVTARTESSDMANKAILESYKSYDIDDVKWLTSSTPCALCAPNDGRVFKRSEAEGLIPYHHQCECTWTAETKA